MSLIARLDAALGGRYQIERKLGAGAMATVYLARDLRHDRLVAVKVLDPELSAAVGAERFMREIRVTARLTHPNIIALLDSGAADGLLYYVTPFAAGESLRARLEREGPLPIADAVRIARDVADALALAHAHGIIHRDVKPENVLLVSDHAVVADFGIARAVDVSATTALTATGLSVGTPAYMSPEQGAGTAETADGVIDGRSDVYSLGCVLYEMLVGEPPFRAQSVQAMLAQHASRAAPSVREQRDTVPVALERVVARALAKAPADRFRSAAEMRAALDAVVMGGGDIDSVARSTIAPARRWRRLTVTTAVAALLIAAAALTWRAERRVAEVMPASTATRLAILPMANLSPDGADRYFADGMTDELISTLSSIRNLRIIARSSVLAYAGTAKPAHQIGRELGVGAVIESTCRKAGSRLRITVRLIDAQSDEQRWTEQYDRELADVFAIQHDVATRVAQALKVRLLASESRRLARQATTNLDAYELYIRAKLLIADHQGAPLRELAPALDSGIAMLRRAVALDSSFAAAHAALGRAYISQIFIFAPGPALVGLAAAEVQRALTLDSTLADAYYARGDLAYTRETGWRIEDALRDYAHALALAPNLADAHAAFGSQLMHAGLLDEALRELRATLALDPQNRFVPPRIARVLWFEQRYDSSLARTVNPAFAWEHALVLGYLGRPDSGLRYLDRAPPGASTTADIAGVRAVLLAQLGRSAEADAQIQLAASAGPPASHFHHAEFNIAAACALMGRSDEALHWLERTANDGMPAYPLFANDPHLASLHGDPRFARFLSVERARHARFLAVVSKWDPDRGS